MPPRDNKEDKAVNNDRMLQNMSKYYYKSIYKIRIYCYNHRIDAPQA
jgi:hypothetical protein